MCVAVVVVAVLRLWLLLVWLRCVLLFSVDVVVDVVPVVGRVADVVVVFLGLCS